jgi:hypothetical protein
MLSVTCKPFMLNVIMLSIYPGFKTITYDLLLGYKDTREPVQAALKLPLG